MNLEVSQKLIDTAKGINRITRPIINDIPKLGRNEPCWCGSGIKYKKCCWIIERECSAEMREGIEINDSQPCECTLENLSTDDLLEIVDSEEGENGV